MEVQAIPKTVDSPSLSSRSPTTTIAAGGCHSSAGRPSPSGSRRVYCRKVDSNADPHQQPVRDIAAKVGIVRERIVAVVRFVGSPHVCVVCGDGLRVGAVRRDGLHCLSEVHGEEDLPYVVDDAAGIRVVGEYSALGLCEEVDVRGATCVVAGEDCVEGHDAG